VQDQIKSIPGVVDTGLFLGLAKIIIIGKKDGSVEVRE
jgi:ribose 5-phosphate isomerase